MEVNTSTSAPQNHNTHNVTSSELKHEWQEDFTEKTNEFSEQAIEFGLKEIDEGVDYVADRVRKEYIFRSKPKVRYSDRDYWEWHDQLYLGGSWKSSEWRIQVRRVRDRDGNKCVRCGVDCDLQTDHIVPLSKMGSNEMSNLQTLCRNCHEDKTGRPLKSFS